MANEKPSWPPSPLSPPQRGYPVPERKEHAGYQGPTNQNTSPPSGGSGVKPPPSKNK